MNQSNPERTGRAMTMREIREALGHNVNPQPPVDRAAWVDGDPLLEAIARAVWEQCSTEGTSLVVDDPRNIAAVAASVARAAVRAETLRDAEEICDEAGAVYTSKALNEQAGGAYALMERFRRKAEEAETATPAVVAPPADRAAVAERLWQVAEQNIVAEWICCDPINPKHQLCVQGDATLRMVRALLVDDPKAAKPAAPLLDAILDVLPEPTDRAAVLDAAADHFDRMGRTVLAASQVRDELHRMAVEARSCRWEHPHPGYRCEPRTAVEAHGTGTQQPTDTEAHPPRHSWLVEWSADGDDWAVAYPTHDHSKALDRLARGRRETPDWQWRLVRETTTYTVEEPAPVAQQPAAEETGEERADRQATERDHARGDHTYCGITCETEMPTEHLRNFVIAKGYPGTRGALDELLRRARAEVAEQQAAAEAWDVPDARPGTTDYTLQQQAAAADGEETP